VSARGLAGLRVQVTDSEDIAGKIGFYAESMIELS
jgi:hypothetical protein